MSGPSRLNGAAPGGRLAKQRCKVPLPILRDFWAVIEKTFDRLIGVTGLISEEADNENHVGLGYIYYKSHWGNGYAFEATSACLNYAFNFLHLSEITAQVRPDYQEISKVTK